jgi:hypothetical protein
MNEETKRLIRVRGAHSTPKATPETRAALIAAERGLTKKQMAKYWVQRRKNCKPLFDYWAFAKAQDISTDWLFDGDSGRIPAELRPGRASRDASRMGIRHERNRRISKRRAG